MRKSIRVKVLLAGACMMAGFSAWGQQAGNSVKQTTSSIDVAVVYNPLMANVVGGNGFWMQGASAQVHGQFWHGLGFVADVSGLHTANTNGPSGVGLDMVTATFGPRYTWSPAHRRYALFGQALAGEAFGMNSVFPNATGANDSANSLAMQLGGGLNLRLSHHIALRAFEADWLRTQSPNATTNVQNNLCLGAGLVYRFK
jgi:hypothetical protein